MFKGIFQGDTMSVMNLKNGATRNLDLKQVNELLQIIDGKVSRRKRYLKIALLAALKYDHDKGDGYLTSSEVSQRARKYTNKNTDMSSRVAGNLLGNLYRLGILDRTNSPPYQYRLRDGV
jgi:hypothetical protein